MGESSLFVTILVVDDHPLYREGVAAALRHAWPEARVLFAASAAEGVAALRANPATDLVLVDVRLGADDGEAAAAAFGRAFPQVARVMVSGVEGAEAAERARRAGASGFLTKSMSVTQIVAALRRILEGGVHFESPPAQPRAAPASPDHLTLRQIETLVLAAKGCTNKDIARRLGIAERTVKFHLNSAFQALGAANRTQAVLNAARLGIVPSD
jgi:DNA-binding NarL/FixJ family response regulator